MLVTRTSELSGRRNTRDIPLTEIQMNRINNRLSTGELIQDIIPNVDAGEREFILTGITPMEWEEVMTCHKNLL